LKLFLVSKRINDAAVRMRVVASQGMVSSLPSFVRVRSSSNSTSKAASAALDAVLEALADDEVGSKQA